VPAEAVLGQYPVRRRLRGHSEEVFMAASNPCLPAVDSRQVRAALTAIAPRLSALVRSITNPGAAAVGDWTVGDVAVHLAHVWEALPALARGEMEAPLEDLGQLSHLTDSLVRDEPERDIGALAARIDAGSARFFAWVESAATDEPGPWLVGGIRVPSGTIACHLLNESLIHGYDIARAEHAAWTITPADAALALMGFVFPMLARLDPRALVDQEKARGLRACFEIHVRRAGRVVIVVDDGAATIAPPSTQKVDCHLSADPAALFLVMWGRVSQWPAVMRGQVLVWGRRPWLGPRLRSVLRSP
jgi:uncharacterized protein (TIGR03083 family)